MVYACMHVRVSICARVYGKKMCFICFESTYIYSLTGLTLTHQLAHDRDGSFLNERSVGTSVTSMPSSSSMRAALLDESIKLTARGLLHSAKWWVV